MIESFIKEVKLRAALEHELRSSGRLVPSGSFFICGTTDTDIDYFMLDTEQNRDTLRSLEFSNEVDEWGDEYDNMDAFSYRQDEYNVILVKEDSELTNIQMATDVCKKLKLRNRDDRLTVFDAIRRGIGPYDRNLDL